MLCLALLFWASAGSLKAFDMPSGSENPTEMTNPEPSVDNYTSPTCPSCSSSTPTMETCDPFHLERCLDQESCEAAGGMWSENRCVSRITTMKEYMVVAAARHLEPGEDVLATAKEMEDVEPGPAQIGCVLLVPPEDQGKRAQLLMYTYHEGWGWIDLSSMLETREARLGTSVDLAVEVDTSPFAGKKFTVCGGYLTEDGTIGYHCYHVEVQKMEREKAVILGEARHFQGEDILGMVRLEETAQAAPATIGCDLLVPETDQGKHAQLLMFAYHEGWGWIDLSSMLETQEVTLGTLVPVTADVDLAPLAGEEFVVCGGYLTDEGTLGYLCYRLKVQ